MTRNTDRSSVSCWPRMPALPTAADVRRIWNALPEMTRTAVLIPELIDRTSASASARPLTHDEEERLMNAVRAVARLLDDSWTIPGTNVRLGLDALVGLIPGIGDAISAAMSFWIITQAKKLGASRWLLARMSWNTIVDMGVGAVPLVGDAFDVAWKANRKNLALLERHVAQKRSSDRRG